MNGGSTSYWWLGRNLQVSWRYQISEKPEESRRKSRRGNIRKRRLNWKGQMVRIRIRIEEPTQGMIRIPSGKRRGEDRGRTDWRPSERTYGAWGCRGMRLEDWRWTETNVEDALSDVQTCIGR